MSENSLVKDHPTPDKAVMLLAPPEKYQVVSPQVTNMFQQVIKWIIASYYK